MCTMEEVRFIYECSEASFSFKEDEFFKFVLYVTELLLFLTLGRHHALNVVLQFSFANNHTFCMKKYSNPLRQ
jgi:hypothetical protein